MDHPNSASDQSMMTETPVGHYTTAEACSCKDWRYRRAARPCKHVRRLRWAASLLQAQRQHNEKVKA